MINAGRIKHEDSERIRLETEAFLASGKRPYHASPAEYDYTDQKNKLMRYKPKHKESDHERA